MSFHQHHHHQHHHHQLHRQKSLVEVEIKNDNEPKREVQVNVQFLRIGEIDTINEKYYAEISIESKWVESKLIHKYDPKHDWNPKLYIENTILEPKEEIFYEIRKFYDMFIIKEVRHVKGFFWEKLELENFPVDIQELSIVITSKLKINELELKADPEKVSSIDNKASRIFQDQQKWRLYKIVKVSDSASYDTASSSANDDNKLMENEQDSNVNKIQPKFVVSCYCSRLGGYYFYNAYFIIFLITILSLTIFSIDCKYPQSRLQTCFTLVLTSASFKWVINRSLPTISYMTSLDKYAIVCIFYLCLICFWHGIVGSFWDVKTAVKLDLIMLIVFIIIFLIIHIIFSVWFLEAYRSIRNLEKLNEKFIRDLHKNEKCLKIINH